eukprot:327030_1
MSKKKILKPVMVKWTQMTCPAREAKPVPELARPLGRMGVNTAEFCKQFNARSEADGWNPGVQVGVRLFTFSDRTYKFEIRSPRLLYILNHRKFDKPYKKDVSSSSPAAKLKKKDKKLLKDKVVEAKEVLTFGRKDEPNGYIDVREIYELARIKMEDQGNQNDTLQTMAKKIALNCENHNIKVVQFGGKQPTPKLNRMFEPYYNIWTLYEENNRFWRAGNRPFRWQNKM